MRAEAFRTFLNMEVWHYFPILQQCLGERLFVLAKSIVRLWKCWCYLLIALVTPHILAHQFEMKVQLLLDEKLGILDGIHHRLDKAAQTVYAKSHWSTMRSIFPTSFWTDTF